MDNNGTISKMFHDASPTWSGFNYQGKVALYTALAFINNTASDTSRYMLELEWFEDFSIKDGANYVSIHQVKAYNEASLNEYSEAIFKLFEKIATGRAQIAYLHTWKNIDLNGQTWHAGIRASIVQKIESGDSVLSELSNILSQDSRVEEIIGKVKNPGRGRPSDVFKTIKEGVRHYFESNTDKTNDDLDISIMRTIIGNIISGYPSNLATYKGMIDADDTILNKIERFNYTSNNFCGIDSISTLIKEQIAQYYIVTGQPTKANDTIHIERAYLYLLGEIDIHIANRHQEYHNRVKACISFSRLKEILDSPLSDNSEAYYLFHLKNELNRIREVFCEDCIKSLLDAGCPVDETCQKCNLAHAMFGINSLDDFNFKKLCKNLSPEVDSDSINIQSFRKYLPEKGLNSSVFEALYLIEKEYCMDDNKVEYKLNNNIVALITTIFRQGSDRHRNEEERRIADTLLKNIEIEESLREVDLMVSVDVDIPSINQISSIFSNVKKECEEEFNEDMRDEENIVKNKRISVRPIQTVLRELT